MIISNTPPSEPHSSVDPEATSPLPVPPASGAQKIFIGPEGLRAGWSLLIFILLIATLSVPTVAVLRHHPAAHRSARIQTTSHPPSGHQEQLPSSTLTQDGSFFVILLISSFIMSRIEQRPFAAYGIGATPRALPQLLAGLLWGVLFLSLLVLILKSTHLLVFQGYLLSGNAILHFGAEWGLGFLSVGFFEEYLLRGFLLFTLARGLTGIYTVFLKKSTEALGFWTAAILLAFVFGLGHGSNPGESSIGLLTADTAALVFTLSLWRTGSLWWAIGFHAAWDWAQSFLYGVADSGLMMQHHLFASHPVGKPILSGGITGPEGSIFVFPILVLVILVIWTTLPETATSSHPALCTCPRTTSPSESSQQLGSQDTRFTVN